MKLYVAAALLLGALPAIIAFMPLPAADNGIQLGPTWRCAKPLNLHVTAVTQRAFTMALLLGLTRSYMRADLSHGNLILSYNA